MANNFFEQFDSSPDPLFHALINSESGWDQSQIGDGGEAVGYGQLHRGAAADVGLKPEDRYDPDKNLKGSEEYFGIMKNAFPDDPVRAIVGYKRGQGYAKQWDGDIASLDPIARNALKKIDTEVGGTLLAGQRPPTEEPEKKENYFSQFDGKNYFNKFDPPTPVENVMAYKKPEALPPQLAAYAQNPYLNPGAYNAGSPAIMPGMPGPLARPLAAGLSAGSNALFSPFEARPEGAPPKEIGDYVGALMYPFSAVGAGLGQAGAEINSAVTGQPAKMDEEAQAQGEDLLTQYIMHRAAGVGGQGLGAGFDYTSNFMPRFGGEAKPYPGTPAVRPQQSGAMSMTPGYQAPAYNPFDFGALTQSQKPAGLLPAPPEPAPPPQPALPSPQLPMMPVTPSGQAIAQPFPQGRPALPPPYTVPDTYIGGQNGVRAATTADITPQQNIGQLTPSTYRFAPSGQPVEVDPVAGKAYNVIELPSGDKISGVVTAMRKDKRVAITASNGRKITPLADKTTFYEQPKSNAKGLEFRPQEQPAPEKAATMPSKPATIPSTPDLPAIIPPARGRQAIISNPDILQFIASEGGIRPDDKNIGDIKAMDLHERFVPGRGTLVRKQGGNYLDALREKAEEAGYPNMNTVSDLMEAMDNTSRGQRVYATSDLGEVGEREAQKKGTQLTADYSPDEQAAWQHEHSMLHYERQLREMGREVGLKFEEDTPLDQMEAEIEERHGMMQFQKDGGNKFPGLSSEGKLPEGYVRVARGIIGKPSKKFTAKEQQAVDEVNKIVNRMAPGARTHPYSELRATQELSDPQAVKGATIPSKDALPLIVYALSDKPGVTRVMRHEVVHALRRMGKLSGEKWETLKTAAFEKGWIEKHQIEKYWPELKGNKDAMAEEAAAEEFKSWDRGEAKNLSESVVRIFQQIKMMLRQIAAEMRRLFGQKATAEDVLSDIQAGRFARESTRGKPEESTAFDQTEKTPLGDQYVIPGGERSAKQLAAAREDIGKGLIVPKKPQKAADQGLFAEANKSGPFSDEEPTLFAKEKEEKFFDTINGGYKKFIEKANEPRELASDAYKKNFQPELMSDAAMKADPLFAEYHAMRRREKDVVTRVLQKKYDQWNRVPEEESINFMDQVERGAVPKDSPHYADSVLIRRALDKAHEIEKEYGSKADFVENYFPHVWKDVNKAKSTFEKMKGAPGYGPTWFQKARTIDLIKEGLARGLELKSSNPYEILRMRLLSSEEMKQKVELLRGLERQGLAFQTRGVNDPAKLAEHFEISGPDREKWAIRNDIAPLWKNAVDAKSLWMSPTLAGYGFKRWMAFKNLWVPIKLSLSMFHPVHVAHINFSNAMGNAIDHVMRGGSISDAANSAADAFRLLPISKETLDRLGPIGKLLHPISADIGAKAMKAWDKPWARMANDPESRDMVALMTEGGFTPKRPEMYRLQGIKHFKEAIAKNDYVKMLPAAVSAALEALQYPIFDHWIPTMKSQAYMREAYNSIKRDPDLINNDDARKLVLRNIAKGVDRRFGEMNYDNLFWNKAAKDIGHGSLLSLGWQVGNMDFYKGLTVDPVKAINAAVRGRFDAKQYITRRMINAAMYTGTAMLIAGMLTYGLSGKPPQSLMDYTFPNTGDKNPDGTPKRWSTPFFTRELPMLMSHVDKSTTWLGGIGDFAWDKTVFQPIWEMAQNRDFMGNDITDPTGSFATWVKDYGKHIGSTYFTPISVNQAGKQALMGNARDQTAAFLGFGPAPTYANKTHTQKQIEMLYDRHSVPKSRPTNERDQKDLLRNLRASLQNPDAETKAKAMKDALEGGVSAKQLNYLSAPRGPIDQYLFSKLLPQDQIDILKMANPEEKALYMPHLSKQTREEIQKRGGLK